MCKERIDCLALELDDRINAGPFVHPDNPPMTSHGSGSLVECFKRVEVECVGRRWAEEEADWVDIERYGINSET